MRLPCFAADLRDDVCRGSFWLADLPGQFAGRRKQCTGLPGSLVRAATACTVFRAAKVPRQPKHARLRSDSALVLVLFFSPVPPQLVRTVRIPCRYTDAWPLQNGRRARVEHPPTFPVCCRRRPCAAARVVVAMLMYFAQVLRYKSYCWCATPRESQRILILTTGVLLTVLSPSRRRLLLLCRCVHNVHNGL